MKDLSMKSAGYLLWQLLCALLVNAAPASLVPALSLNVTGHTLCNNNVLKTDGGNLPFPFLNLSSNTTSPNPGEIFVYPVAGTIIKLYITFPPNPQPIVKAKLGNTILQTQRTLRTYVAEHNAAFLPLRNQDDPYESNWEGCVFCVTHYPATHRHLTYGTVLNVLQGLWQYLYRGGRFTEVRFQVEDERWGTVGVGGLGLTPLNEDAIEGTATARA